MSAQEICPGQSISFVDQSSGTPTNWQWRFPGGTPATSTQQNPTITYATAGVYDVELIVTNAFGNDTLLETAHISVGQSIALPIAEDFESGTFPETGWSIFNPDNDYTWQNTTAASGFGSGTTSLLFNNYDKHDVVLKIQQCYVFFQKSQIW